MARMKRLPTATALLLACLVCACGDGSDDPRMTAAAPVVLRFQVDGMHCDGCVDAITDKVKRVDGVVDCRVRLQDREADVAVRDANLAAPVRQAIESLHYKVQPLPAADTPVQPTGG